RARRLIGYVRTIRSSATFINLNPAQLRFRRTLSSGCTLRLLAFPVPPERCISDILHSAAPLPTREAIATTILERRPTSTIFRGSGPARKTINGIGSRPNSKYGRPRQLDSYRSISLQRRVALIA